VQRFDGLRSGRFVDELDEGKPARLAGIAIGGQEDLADLSERSEQPLQLCLGCIKGKVPYK